MKKFLLINVALLLVTGGSLVSQTLDEVLAGHFSEKSAAHCQYICL